MVMTLETTDAANADTEPWATCAYCSKEISEDDPIHFPEENTSICDNCHKGLSQTATESAPPELTLEKIVEAHRRKDQVLREAQTELNNLENKQAAARSVANSLKDPIADARAKVERLISCDVSGFLRWEKEQELPLLRKAEEAANAWKCEPVKALDVTEKDKERLAEHFVTCGQVADWLCADFREHKPYLSGEKTMDRLRNAINKISGLET